MKNRSNPSPTPWSVRPIKSTDSRVIAAIIDANGDQVMAVWGNDIKIVESLMVIASAANNGSYGQSNRRVLISQIADTSDISRVNPVFTAPF